MSRRRPKARPLPCATTEPRWFFANRFNDVILDNGEMVVIPAPVTTLSTQRFTEHVLPLIPKPAWIAFMMHGAVHVAPELTAFLDALMEVWPYCDDLDPELAAIANEMLREFIRTLRAKVEPGAITKRFADVGIYFGPVPK